MVGGGGGVGRQRAQSCGVRKKRELTTLLERDRDRQTDRLRQ